MTEGQRPVFTVAPPERIGLTGDRALVRVSADRAGALVASVNESLEHLRPWMAWAQEPATEPAMATFLALGEELWDQRRDFAYSIVEGADERVVGGCGLHGRQDEHALDIGYWIHVDRIGRGLATAVTSALTSAAFAMPGIERVRIQCDDRNVRSARVPEKLGFTFQGLNSDCDRHPGREATMNWVVERTEWVSKAESAAS